MTIDITASTTKIARQPATAAIPAPIVGAMIGTIMKTRKISDRRFAIASPAKRSRITATTITPSAALTSPWMKRSTSSIAKLVARPQPIESAR